MPRLLPLMTTFMLGILVSMSATCRAQAEMSLTSTMVSGLSNSTILIIRHAEKPARGLGLTVAGQARATVYASYFQNLCFRGTELHIDTLVAATDTNNSDRPRLTLLPLSHSTGIPIEQPTSSDEVKGMIRWLQSRTPGRTVLLAWRHGAIARLIAALGADPKDYLGTDRWPPSVYDWVIILHFKADGTVDAGDRRMIFSTT